MRAPFLHVLAGPLLLGLLAAGCNESETVDLSFEARGGTRISYEITIESTVVTRLLGPPEETTERTRLTATEEVLESPGGDHVAVELTVGREGERPHVLSLRLDPEAAVATVETIEGLPVEALGEVAPSHLVLLANGLLPERPLRPGGSWTIEHRLDLPEGPRRLSGEGRLVGLRRDGDGRIARVETVTRLPVERSLALPEGEVDVAGVERTSSTLDYRLGDGTLDRAESLITGRFELTVTPPTGRTRVPVRGTLDLDIRATSERVPFSEPDRS